MDLRAERKNLDIIVVVGVGREALHIVIAIYSINSDICKNRYTIPVVFHNLKNYDAHHIFRSLANKAFKFKKNCLAYHGI